MTLLSLIFKNITRRSVRTLLTVIGISIGIATIVALGAIGDGLKMGLGGVIASGETDFMVAQSGTSDLMFSSIEESKVKELQQMEEVNNAAPVLFEIAQLDTLPYFFVLGLDKKGAEQNKIALVSGRFPSSSGASEVIIGKAASQNIKKKAGDKIVLFSKEFDIVGTYESGDIMKDGGAVAEISTLQRTVKKTGKVTFIGVDAKEGVDIDNLAKRVEEEYKDELSTIKSIDEIGKADQGTKMLDGAVFALSVLAVIIGGIGVANTMIMSVYERTREIGTFRAIGWRKRRIVLMILAESIVTCLLAVIVGAAMGYVFVQLIMLSPAVKGIFYPDFSPQIFLNATYVAVGVGLLGGMYPAYRAANLSPAEALRYE